MQNRLQRMFDIEFDLSGRADGLACLGEVMGRAGIAFEGGGLFTRGDEVIAHFLFKDGEKAWAESQRAGIPTIAMHKPLIRKLKQGTPGQLGAIMRALNDADVAVITQYSDHHNQLILICDQVEKADDVTKDWMP
jgi:hypothetical protein